jgi:hypothetical protein
MIAISFNSLNSDHLTGYKAEEQIPHVLFGARRIYPRSPQAAPQEFLHFQYSSAEAVNNTIWFRLVPQLLNIPLA